MSPRILPHNIRERFDRSALLVRPLSERTHDLGLSTIVPPMPLGRIPRRYKPLRDVAARILQARDAGSPVILMMGAHVLRAGVQLYLVDLMERGLISCLAFNVAGVIHDFEFALIGATTESVARYIRDGQFGLWRETGTINDVINESFRRTPDCGLGEAIGAHIETHGFPHRHLSLLACAHRLGIPATVHVGLGYDIIHEHPNCDGAATGALSYNDFLLFAEIMRHLEDGVVMNFGSAVMAPEVYLKALSMARNVAGQQGQRLSRFTTLVADLVRLPRDLAKEPSKKDPAYYFRPLKTMLIRTVADGGESFSVCGPHNETVPALWTCIEREEDRGRGSRPREGPRHAVPEEVSHG